MPDKTYQRIRAAIALFVGLLVSIATTMDSYLLGIAAVLVGMLFMGLVRAKHPQKVDERELAIREKSANLAYAIFAPTLGLGSFFLLIFARGEYLFLEALGQILAYLALFLIALYALFYRYFSHKL